MEPIYILLLAMFSGFLGSIALWLLYEQRKKIKTMKEKELLEKEVIDGLLELKKYSISDDITENKASKDYDLIELALEQDINDIIISSDEGLPILSTIKESDELAAETTALYKYASKYFKNNIDKILIKSGEEHQYIYKIIKNNIPVYIMLKSKIELEPVNEKMLLKDLSITIDRYIFKDGDYENDEYYESKTHIVKLDDLEEYKKEDNILEETESNNAVENKNNVGNSLL